MNLFIIFLRAFVSIFFLWSHGFAVSFRLSSPEVIKASWNARNFLCEDLNADGLKDLIFFNLERSRIEILYRTMDGEIPPKVSPVQADRWNPDLEDAPYKKEYIFVPERISALAVGDLNGDGLLDLVQGSPEHGVQVNFRSTKDSEWDEPLEVESGKMRSDSLSIKIKKRKKAGFSELFLFTEEGLEVIEFNKGKQQFPSRLFREESKSAHGLHLLDLNDDKIDDWLYLDPSKKRSIRLRFGLEEGFGPEHSYDLSLFSFNPVNSGKESKDFRFVGIDRTSKEVTIFSMVSKQKEENDESEYEIMSHDFFPEDEKKSVWIMEDFNADGKTDLIAASPKLGELLFLPGHANAEFRLPQKIPSLRGITSLASCRFSTLVPPGLLVLSPEEKIVGLSKYNRQKRFLFPKPLNVEGEVILSACADLDGDELDEILVLVEKRSDFVLQIWSNQEGKEYQISSEIELDEWKREPSAIFPCHLDSDGHIDLLLLSSREAGQLLLNNGMGTLTLVGTESAIRKSMLLEKNRSRVGSGDIDGDGSPELLIAGKGMIRAIKWFKGNLQVVEQFNSSDSQAELLCPILQDVDSDGEIEMVYFTEDHWEVLKRSQDGIFEKTGEIEEGTRVPQLAYPFTLNEKKGFYSLCSSGIDVIGKSGLTMGCSLKVHSRYLTDLPQIVHGGVDWGDFDHDGVHDLVCMDGRKNVLEFLSYSAATKSWQSVLHFQVFEKDLHYRGKKGGVNEPRDGLIADLNGDGRDDLVLLVHDRFLCYYQNGD